MCILTDIEHNMLHIYKKIDDIGALVKNSVPATHMLEQLLCGMALLLGDSCASALPGARLRDSGAVEFCIGADDPIPIPATTAMTVPNATKFASPLLEQSGNPLPNVEDKMSTKLTDNFTQWLASTTIP